MPPLEIRRGLRLVVAATLVLGSVACDRAEGTSAGNADSARPAAARSTVPVMNAPRRFDSVTFDTAWIVRGGASDTTLGYTAGLTSSGDLVIVADPGMHRVTALKVSDGSVAWTYPRASAGSRSTMLPSGPEAAPDGGAAVPDAEAGTLTILTKTGAVRRTIAHDVLTQLGGLCAHADGSVLLQRELGSAPYVRLTADGAAAPIDTLPHMNGAPVAELTVQGAMAPTKDHSACVVAYEVGPGLRTWDGSSFSPLAEYVERVPFEEPDTMSRTDTLPDWTIITETMSTLPKELTAARDVAVRDGVVYVLFSGATPEGNQGRLIDRYDAATLRYLGSLRLPVGGSSFAVPKAGLYVLEGQRNGYPMIIALRAR